MKVIFPALILACSFAAPSTAQTDADVYQRLSAAPFCDTHAPALGARVMLRLGMIDAGRRDLIPETVACFAGLQRNFGDVSETMPTALTALLAADPAVFIHTMAQHPDEFAWWLSRLGQAFVWEHNGPNPLEAYRQRVILVTQSADVAPVEVPLKARILERLRAVRPRTID